MSATSSFKPFLIGAGQSKTGLFQYLESWVKPEDAFDDIQNAYVNRGQLWKRDGQTLLGVLTYCNNQLISYGNGATGPFTGTFSSHLPILAGSVTIKARENNGVNDLTETFTSNATTPVATLTGDNGGSGTINLVTGVYSITTGSNANSGAPIMIEYTYTPTSATNQFTNTSVVKNASLVPSGGPYSGTYTQNLPISPGTAFIIVSKTATGTVTYLDDGAGNFRTSLPAGTIVGSINYSTGVWTFTVDAAGTLRSLSPIQLGFTSATTSQSTIMGITQWNNETNNTFDLVVEDCRRASVYDVTGQKFNPICDVAETLFIVPTTSTAGTPVTPQTFDNGTTGVFPTFGLLAPLSVTISVWNPVTGLIIDTTTDDGAGGFPTGSISGTIFTTGSSVDYYSGRIVIVLRDRGALRLTQGWAINASFKLQNDYFTGDQSNFFNWTNWEPATNLIVATAATVEDPTQYQRGFLYLTNNVDPITLYRNGVLSRPSFALRQAVLGLGKNEILRCLDIKTFASRLLIVRPTTTISDGNPDPQSIRWSAQFQPTNTVADIPGSGGELSAATSDWIQSTKFLKDFIVVHMQNSVWYFKFTGSAFAPFQFYKANTTKNTSAPYGSIEFDEQVTAMGTKGLTFCDGQAIDRYDLKIIDQFETINSTAFKQCFGQRFDILNQAWMLYPDSTTNETLSNKVLLFNYVEDSWATFNMPLSCLGFGFGVRDDTWADFALGSVATPDGLTWQQAQQAWNSYLEQKETLRLLGGDFNGRVLQLNDGPTDAGTEVIMDVTTKKYNPFAGEMGIKGLFAYLDVYYTVNSKVKLTFDFYIDNNSSSVAYSQNIYLTGTPNAAYGWQRIFINIQTAQIQWRIRDNGITSFRILGQILWASPAGRITQ